jgi:prepilin-type N-terminal cleavage/methylation domain-containing protein
VLQVQLQGWALTEGATTRILEPLEIRVMFDVNEMEKTERPASPRDSHSNMASQKKNEENKVCNMCDRRGFSLLECMIVMLILAVGLLGMGGLMGTAIKSGATSKEMTTAAILLQEKCESLNRVPFNVIVSGNDTPMRDGVSYSRQWAVSSVADTKAIRVSVAVNGRQVKGEILRGR